jgi:FO synthase
MWALLPLKSPDEAKSRLAPVLDRAQRRQLFFSLADRMVRALRATQGIETVAVITSSDEVDAFARSLGARVIRQPADSGTANAHAAAVKSLPPGVERVLMISGDLPQVTPAALQRLVDAACDHRLLVAPDRHRIGTNALVCSPPDAIVPQFGTDSFRRHLEAGAHPIDIDELARDVDIPEDADWRDLAPLATQVRERGWGSRVSYSRKVFVPLTQLCRDVCHYCTFAKTPRNLDKPYLEPEDVLRIARQGAALGCKEVLFTLGDQPELRYTAARKDLDRLGFGSTIDYLEHVASLVVRETGLLPHVNAGLLDAQQIARLRRVAPSMGLMLESSAERLCQRGGPHFGSPDKLPSRRLETLRLAGEARVPMTSGILIGIGETRRERLDSLTALRELHARYGHIQEVIVQNFRAKAGTKMHAAPEPSMDELCWTVAAARLILGPDMSIQAPPNLYSGDRADLIAAGINDWGGVSPLTPDHVNPEAPWPQIDQLGADTARAGCDLVERLTVYPRYVRARSQWIAPELQGAVLKLSDAAGLARVGTWSPGSTAAASWDDQRDVPTVAARRRRQPAFALTEHDIANLFTARGADFVEICERADALRADTVGDTVSYAVVRNINYTNVCTYKCAFCAFSKGRAHENLRGKPYLVEIDEIQRRVLEAWQRGGTEVCMQGGIHPDFTGQTYLGICRAAKQAQPQIHVHAFSPLEVSHGAQTLGISVAEFLAELKHAGLGSLPGTAAEILDDEIRQELAPGKLSTQEWLEVVRQAHRAGLPTTSTIMFGHIEGYEHWARHLLHLRRLQQETGGLTEFVPLPFVHMEAPMYLRGRARKGPTLREAILMHAVARLVLHPYVKNIQASWVKLGPQWAQRCLTSGANDLGGTLMNESISRAAGAQHGQELGPLEMQKLIAELGRTARQRTTLYADADATCIGRAQTAAPLEPTINAPLRRVAA